MQRNSVQISEGIISFIIELKAHVISQFVHPYLNRIKTLQSRLELLLSLKSLSLLLFIVLQYFLLVLGIGLTAHIRSYFVHISMGFNQYKVDWNWV